MARTRHSYVLGYFKHPQVFKRSCAESVAAGYKDQEAFTPYPLHGLEHALGIKRSWVGRPVLFMLLFGALCGFLMQYWMLKWAWPVIIGGKPFNSWPAYVVITFESGILSGALLNMFLVLIIACRLWGTPDTRLPRPSLSDDTFCLALPVREPGQIGPHTTWLREHGAEEIDIFHPDPDGRDHVAATIPIEESHARA